MEIVTRGAQTLTDIWAKKYNPYSGITRNRKHHKTSNSGLFVNFSQSYFSCRQNTSRVEHITVVSVTCYVLHDSCLFSVTAGRRWWRAWEGAVGFGRLISADDGEHTGGKLPNSKPSQDPECLAKDCVARMSTLLRAFGATLHSSCHIPQTSTAK